MRRPWVQVAPNSSVSVQSDASADEDFLRQDVKRGGCFADGIEGWSGERLTARELAMLQLTESITDKPGWDRKIFDDAIVAKWHAEAMALPLISEPAWQWVLTEVREKAEAFRTSRKVAALDSTARCAKSDVLVSPELRAELIAGVAPLLSVPGERKDWHPGSNGQVLNLVHPSLYPLVYGRTRVLDQGCRVDLADMLASCGQGEVATQTEHESAGYFAWSSRFQWLPCEVGFSGDAEDDTTVRIASYINNLHPTTHQSLYRTIEEMISLSVPLWNDVVMYGTGVRTPRRIVTYGAEWTPPELPDWAEWDNLPSKTTDHNFAEVMQKVKEYLALPDRPGYRPDADRGVQGGDWEDLLGNEQDPDMIVASLKARLARTENDASLTDWEFSNAIHDLLERKWERIRYVSHPEPGQSFTYEGKMNPTQPVIETCCRHTADAKGPYEEWKEGVQRPIIAPYHYGEDIADRWPKSMSLQKRFRDQGLQVIVKLASVELTPDHPRYPGGSWHLEGMKNEHIVATSIYYYDAENTTPSHLSFRQGASLEALELQYEQDDHEPLSTVFGTASMRNEPAVQVIGRIATPGGRILAFPNTLQHKVEPFELADNTKPGHRRFLVLWLVDPHSRICSTRSVPPQQHDWWAEEAMRAVDFGTLPQEVVDLVKGNIGEWPMGLDEAKALRLELMAERTVATDSVESTFEEYNLCEH